MKMQKVEHAGNLEMTVPCTILVGTP